MYFCDAVFVKKIAATIIFDHNIFKYKIGDMII